MKNLIVIDRNILEDLIEDFIDLNSIDSEETVYIIEKIKNIISQSISAEKIFNAARRKSYYVGEEVGYYFYDYNEYLKTLDK